MGLEEIIMNVLGAFSVCFSFATIYPEHKYRFDFLWTKCSTEAPKNQENQQKLAT